MFVEELEAFHLPFEWRRMAFTPEYLVAVVESLRFRCIFLLRLHYNSRTATKNGNNININHYCTLENIACG